MSNKKPSGVLKNHKNNSVVKTNLSQGHGTVEERNSSLLGSEREGGVPSQESVAIRGDGNEIGSRQNRQIPKEISKEGSSKNTAEKERYNKLQQSRIKDQRRSMRATSSKSITARSGKSSLLKRRRGKRGKGNLNVSQDTALAAANSYKEISPSEDVAHIIAIGISIGADLGTLVPVLNWIVAPLAIMTLWVVYLLGGHWQKRIGRKVVVSGISYAAEMIPVASALPAFTIAAVLNYHMALTEKRLIKMQNNEV